MNEAIDPITLELAPDADQAVKLLAFREQIGDYILGRSDQAPEIQEFWEARSVQIVLKGLAGRLSPDTESRFMYLSRCATKIINVHDPEHDWIRGDNLADATFRVNIGGSR